MKAILQSNLSKLTVNREGRIVEGVKLLENNRDVTYRGADGKPMGFRTNDALLSGLVGHAGNRTIPAHLTHDWTDGKEDALKSRVGGHKNIRIDDAGDLAGDFHAMPGIDGDRMLWLAENDPEHCALSCIFDYNAIKTDGVTYAYPLDFASADFVAKGAGVKALLTQSDTDMTKEEIVALIKENAASKDDVTAAVRAALSEFKPAGVITKEDSDKAIQAALSVHKPTLTDAQIAEIATLNESKLVAKLGAGPLQLNLKAHDGVNTYEAKLAEYRKVAPNEATAVARLLKDCPEFNEARQHAVSAERAKLSNAA